MASFQFCSAQSCFSVNRFSSSIVKKNGAVYASAENPSRRLALFQLSTVLSQSQLFCDANAKLLRTNEGIETIMPITDIAQATTSLSEESILEWTKTDNRRLLHVVYHVSNLDKTIKFYTECLGMKVLRKRDLPEDGYSNAFLGYGPEVSNFTMELAYNYGVDNYDIGTGFGHYGFAVENAAKVVGLMKFKGARVTKEPVLVKDGGRVAFAEDPDGYTCKLIETGPTSEPLSQVMLRVGDLDRSIDFYKKAYGMELIRKRDNPENKYTTAVMGYGPEDKNAVVELTYNYGIKEYNKGNGYVQIAIGTDDVYKTAEAIKYYGGEIIREPGPLPGLNTKITACLDPDGWKTAFVDNIDFLKELE
ncbi:hypothetical protein RD792_006570 [Penstemon davidsonii]|uniref:lactoylglutathione lyase n=1 Tax=Penstemon davidsonii TaxID=160366 RepID=A0ABR0DC93_9LAMI|nr:hypothetical protein RD792_006570 [Penstemon davidsonii]